MSMNLQEIERKKLTYINYLKMKLNEEDWHGVADCAMDLRELEIEKKCLSELYNVAKQAQTVVRDPRRDIGVSDQPNAETYRDMNRI